MKGICGYGRYDDDPKHVGCPRAKSDMTPCIARDGALALADPSDPLGETCVGCNAEPWDLLVEMTSALGEKPGRKGSTAAKRGHAERLRLLVRTATEPLRDEAGSTAQ